jgi:hypothetical protein
MSEGISRDNIVSIVTCCRQDSTRIESRWGQIFHICPNWPWGLRSLLYIGYHVSFPGVKWPGHGDDHPPHLALRLKKELSYTSVHHLGLHGLF